MISLDYAIDTVNQLPIEQQKILVNILHHRHIEERRREIAKDARQSVADFHAGRLKPQPVQEIISELAMTSDDINAS